MKVVIFWANILHYHAARIRSLYELFDNLGIELYAISIQPKSDELPVQGYQQLLQDKIEVLMPSHKFGMNHPLSVYQIARRLNMIKPDAVAIIGYSQLVSLSAMLWCRIKHSAAILMLSTQEIDFPRSFFKEWIKSKIITGYDAVLVGGKSHARYARQLGIKDEQIFTGYEVVDNDFWSQQAEVVRKKAVNWRNNLNLPEKYILSSCRFVPKKNLDGLLYSYSSYLSQAGPNPFHLVIAGDGPLYIQIKNLARDLYIQDMVHFPGYLETGQLIPYYALASVFVLASSYSEQWGLVVNEAMAVGLPVLVSKICGCSEDLVIEGVTGYSFDPSDANNLANLLVKISSCEADIIRLGQNAKSHIQKYSPNFFANNLLAAAKLGIIHASERRR
jgi:glycosyltransferase involved in cell wall biosynthesis